MASKDERARLERAREVAKLRKWDPTAAAKARRRPLPEVPDPRQLSFLDGVQVDLLEAIAEAERRGR